MPGCREIVDNGRDGWTLQVRKSADRTEKVQSFINLIIEEHTYTGRERFAEHETEVDDGMAVSRYVDLTSELQRLPSGSGAA